MSKRNRENFCSCGSGKKYKKCCMIKQFSRSGRSNSIEQNEYDVTSQKWTKGKRRKLWDDTNWEG